MRSFKRKATNEKNISGDAKSKCSQIKRRFPFSKIMQNGTNITKKKSNTRRRMRNDSEEDASEASDYEKHDTDDEDTEEARSEIGEDSDSGEKLERQNNENVRPG
ncbi:hypothetical protein JTB14_014564 [Gonioctena quinquepunctata]|nr:hypothetical protein JTB14_014564 [Gonioctena quinquepunctata]